MSMRARAVFLAIACILGACTTAPAPEPAPAPAPAPIAHMVDEEGNEIAAVAIIEPSPAMLKAALADDPEAMRDAAAVSLTGCQAATTCPTSFASCSSWSASTMCEQACNIGVCLCRPVWACEGEPPEVKGSESFNAFRVCFNSTGQSCTEWTKTTNTVCGC